MFENLRTVTQQDNYFKEKLNVIYPERISLGREFIKYRKKGFTNIKCKVVSQDIICVPLEKLVEKLIYHPDYKYLVENGSNNTNLVVLNSFMKGAKCKKNKILIDHPDAIRFVLYYDDLEVCSPLKSRSGKQKLGAFYLFIDNVPRKFRSNLSLICLVALVNASYVKSKSYGIDAALEEI